MSEIDALPPRPPEILDDDRVAYQAVTQLSDGEYRRLADDIRERGVLQPIIVDEDGTILDGHHRAALAEYFELDESRQPAEIVVGDLDGDGEKLARAIKQNLIGRDTGEAVKTHAVEQYIETTWDRTDDDDLIRPETNTEVAEKLGVSEALVTEVCKKFTSEIITHDRVKAREYYENNPDASYREVARQVDASNKTVTAWLKEDFDEADDDDEQQNASLTALVQTEREREQAADVFKTADGAGEEVQQTAEANAERLARGETSPTTARKNVEKVQAEREVEQQRQSSTEDAEPPTVKHADAADLLEATDSADLLLTDPPYTTDVDDVQAFARSWVPEALDVIGDDGVAFVFVGAYADELQTYLNVLDECGVRDRTQVLVWTYRNTLGRAPADEYKRNWQAILFIQSDPATEIDAPLTSEQWAVQDINAPDGRHDGRHHKWEKPTELVERLIRHTTAEGDTVLDPFVGTGTTALVARDLGRQIRAGDTSSEMLEIAAERGCVVDE
jgi:ParB-like chromosome segregation protein Spo0J